MSTVNILIFSIIHLLNEKILIKHSKELNISKKKFISCTASQIQKL